jgi:hypothetical protein
MAPYLHQDFTYHYALVCTSTDSKENTLVSIGGATPVPLSGGNWYNHEEAGMSFYNFPLADFSASYIFSNPAKIIIYGWGRGPYRSYYYLAGSAMRDLDAAFYAHDIHFQNLKENPFCANEMIEFRSEIEGLHTAPGSLLWYIDGVHQPALTDKAIWNQTFSSGLHEIRMWVRYENNDTISKTGTLFMLSCSYSAGFYVNNVHYEILQDTTFCDKNVHFRAEIADYSEIKWFIDGSEYIPAHNLLEWNKEFATGVYSIQMWVRYENNEEIFIPAQPITLKMEIFWVKIRNVRY